MANAHESHAGITAEIRARAGAWMDDKLKQYDERLADRLEAAHKRERGNAAKLREALVQVQGCADGALMAISHENVPIQHMWDIIDVCKAALSITNQDTQED